MFEKCNLAVRIVLVGVLAVVIAGCSEKSRNPLSPNIAGPISGVNISAPAQAATVGDELVRADEQPVVLTFAASLSDSERPFWYELEISTDAQFASIVHASGQIEPTSAALAPSTRSGQNVGGTQTYVVPEALVADLRYYWRVRAADGANAGPFSDIAQFEIFTPLTIGAPSTLSPINGQVIGGFSPNLKATLAEITGPATDIKYRFEIATDSAFTDLVAVLTAAPDGQTTLATSGNLTADTRYSWRVRASASGRVGWVHGPWSESGSFKTPPLPVSAPSLPPPSLPPPPPPATGGSGGGGGGCCPPPNRFSVVQQVAAETGYPNSGISVHAFTQRVAERLAAEDANWGRYLNSNGNLGKDTVSYRVNGRNAHPFKIDIVRGAGSSSPKPHWVEHGLADGTWKSVN